MADEKSKSSITPGTDPVENRRRIVRQLLVGSGVVAGAGALPERWSKPITESVILPAHAQTTVTDGTVELGGNFSLQASGDTTGGGILDSLVGRAHAGVIELDGGCIKLVVTKIGNVVTSITVQLSDKNRNFVGPEPASVNPGPGGSAAFNLVLDGNDISGTVNAAATIATGTVGPAEFTATQDGASGCPPSPCPPGYYFIPEAVGRECYAAP